MKLLTLRATFIRESGDGEELLTVNCEVGSAAVITAMATERWTDPVAMNQAQYLTAKAANEMLKELEKDELHRDPFDPINVDTFIRGAQQNISHKLEGGE